MLLNISSQPQENKEVIDKELGKVFDLKMRNEMGGTSSGKWIINSASIDIHNLLILNQGLNTCTIEMRPDGILIRFQVLLENYALVIPYYKLKMQKGSSEEYSIHKDHYFIRIKADRPEIHEFLKKIRLYKANHWSSSSPLP